MKKLLLIPILFVCGCASASPLDLVTPTVLPYALEEYLGHDLPDFKGFTSLSVLKAAQQEIEWKHSLDATMYAIASESTAVTIRATESARDGVLALAAALGVPGAGVLAYRTGLKKPRPGDIPGDKHKAELDRVGKMPPEQYEKEKS